MTYPLPPVDRLREVFNYDPETGILTWRVTLNNRRVAGCVAGGLHKSTGYYRVSLDGVTYNTHRICYAIYHGVDPGNEVIDHINRCRTDNRINNLRTTTQTNNLYNCSMRSSNTSGHTGVSLDRKNRWRAYINVGGRCIELGRYKTREEAINARLKAEQEYGVFISR
jgi:hypothetical protein